MGEILWIMLFVMAFISCNAFPDLSGVHWVNGTWMGSTTLPCTYTLSEGFTLQTLSWSMERDSSTSTVFRRDDSGDHIFLSRFRGRVSVPKHSPGDASLLIENLEIPDSGRYTCQVIWRSGNNSSMTKEMTTTVKVLKVPASKPTVRAGERGLAVPAGSSASLTCEASGSPPLRYRWFRGGPGEVPRLLRSQPELAWGSLRPSDAGTYFCEAEGRVGAAQRSDAVELVVTDPLMTTAALPRDVGITRREHPTTDLPTTAVTLENGVGYPEKNYTTHDFQRTHLPLYLVIVIAVACGAVVFLVIFLIICIRKPKEAQVYEVKFHNSRSAAARCESTGHYEEPISFTENNYVTEPMKNKSSDETNMRKNEYDCVGNTQESEYEVGNTV